MFWDPVWLASIRSTKLTLASLATLPNDVIHVYLGLLLWLGAETLRRSGRPAGSRWRGLLPVVALALALEIPDVLINVFVDGRLSPGENVKDLVLTSFLPFLLAAVTRQSRPVPASS